MAFKIVNPHWKSAVQKKAETHAPAVAGWLAANPADKLVGLLELRTALPAIANELSREVVNHICAILGLEIQGADDKTN